MAKAIVCTGTTQIVGATATISYTVSLLGPPNLSYSADYLVDTTISMNANLIAWRTKIIAEALARGVTLLTSDVIVFGGPV